MELQQVCSHNMHWYHAQHFQYRLPAHACPKTCTGGVTRIVGVSLQVRTLSISAAPATPDNFVWSNLQQPLAELSLPDSFVIPPTARVELRRMRVVTTCSMLDTLLRQACENWAHSPHIQVGD